MTSLSFDSNAELVATVLAAQLCVVTADVHRRAGKGLLLSRTAQVLGGLISGKGFIGSIHKQGLLLSGILGAL